MDASNVHDVFCSCYVVTSAVAQLYYLLKGGGMEILS